MTALETRLLAEGAELELPGGFRSVLLTRSRDRKGLQGIHLVKHRGIHYIYKVYGCRRHATKAVLDRIAARIEGRSTPDPAGRLAIERRCLRVWRENGFDVFREIESAPAISFGAPALCLEYVPGQSAMRYFADTAVGRKERLDALSRLADAWGRRHELARRLNEPLLIHEHPSLTHIWHGEDGRFYHFDFEVVYTGGRLSERIAREALRLVRALLRYAPAADREEYLDVFLKHYRPHGFLRIAYQDLWRSPNPFVRLYRLFERLGPRARLPFSQFDVARMVMERLSARDAGVT